MASNIRLSTLIEAITRAIAYAQDEVDKHQVRNLLRYFDDESRPRMIPLQVPARRAGATEKDFDTYKVPLISLVPMNALKIKDVSIKLAVDMGEITEEDITPSTHGDIYSAKDGHGVKKALPVVSKMKAMSVSTSVGRQNGKVQITLTLQGSEPSEGTQRMVDYINQVQGVHDAEAPRTS